MRKYQAPFGGGPTEKGRYQAGPRRWPTLLGGGPTEQYQPHGWQLAGGLPNLYAVAGGLVLLGTWYFFGRRLLASDAEWYAWIRPMLLALGGVLCIVAAGLTAVRHPSGQGLLQLAVGIVPLVFAVGLLILPIRFIGGVMDRIGGNAALPSFDGVIDRLWSSPQRLALNLVIIAAVILLGFVGRAAKSRAEQEEQHSKQ